MLGVVVDVDVAGWGGSNASSSLQPWGFGVAPAELIGGLGA